MGFEVEMPKKEGGTSIYLSHHANMKKWYLGGRDGAEIKLEYIQLDPATLATGWGKYNSAEKSYTYIYDKVMGAMEENLSENDPEFKRAFSCYVMVHGYPEPVVWRRNSYGELKGWEQMLGTYWDKKNDAVQGQLPTFKYTGSEQHKDYPTSIPQFEFVAFKDRWEGYNVPQWYLSEIGSDAQPIGNVEIKKTVTTDDIPF